MRCGDRALSVFLTCFSFGFVPTICVGDLVSAGDLAFTGYNQDGSDSFAIVLLADAAASDVVYFSDREWNGSSLFGAESEISWTVGGTGLSAGTVVTFDNLQVSPSASTGTPSGGTMSLSGDETIYAFLRSGPMNSETFLGAISNTTSDYDGTTGTLAGTGLSQGTTALVLPMVSGNLAHVGSYIGPRSGEAAFADYLGHLSETPNPTKWDVRLSAADFDGFGTAPFSVSASSTPEPASLSLMLLGATLGCAFLRRRTRKQEVLTRGCAQPE